MKPYIIPIDNSNIEMVVDLLYERSQTLKLYTEWKYHTHNADRFKGVISLVDGKPAGCFGSIPKELKFSDGTNKTCGWFADWYVSPNFRGLKIGELMLNALSEYEAIMFGHPGPKLAQSICMKNGYKPIGFHSRRRLILRKWSYNIKRGNLYSGIFGKVKMKLSSGVKAKPIHQVNDIDLENTKLTDKENLIMGNFAQTNDYENWVLNQPVAKQFKRENGEWKGNRCFVKYFDEQMENGEKRRLVLFMDGENIDSVDNMNSFINDTRKAKQDYIEIFTTNKQLDSLLHHMGAWYIKEAPIMVRGLNSESMNFHIQPWDRENWTYLSSN